MKKINLILLGFVLMLACNNEDDEPKPNASQSNGSGVVLRIEKEQDFEQIIVGKVTSDSSSTDTDTFNVIIENSESGDIVYNDTYHNLEDTLSLEPGTYSLTISNDVPVGFSNKIKYTGTNNFSISPNEYVNENIWLSIRSFQITMNYSDNFKNKFTNYEAFINETDSFTDTLVNSTKIDATKPYYYNNNFRIDYTLEINADNINYQNEMYFSRGSNYIFNVDYYSNQNNNSSGASFSLSKDTTFFDIETNIYFSDTDALTID